MTLAHNSCPLVSLPPPLLPLFIFSLDEPTVTPAILQHREELAKIAAQARQRAADPDGEIKVPITAVSKSSPCFYRRRFC